MNMTDHLPITIIDNFNIDDCRRYYVEIILTRDNENHYFRLANNYDENRLELLLTDYLTADRWVAPFAILKHNELLVYKKLVELTKDTDRITVNLRELSLADVDNGPLKRSSLYDDRTKRYYSIPDNYSHHLLIRYVALDYLMETNVVNETNYQEFIDVTYENVN